MKEYLDLVKRVMGKGILRSNRTAIPAYSCFGEYFYYQFPKQDPSNVIKGFPLLTTKKIGIKSTMSEMLWMLEGSTDERRLAEIRYEKPRSELVGKRTIWTDNAENQGKALGYPEGELGPIYGHQWRNFNGVDQLKELVKGLKEDPFGRRHLVSAWNVTDLPFMALPPCHLLWQVYVYGSEKPEGLGLQWYMRSLDVALGLPFDISLYAGILGVLCQILNLPPVSLSGAFGDTHIYENSVDMLKEQITHDPYPLPDLEMPVVKSLDDLERVKVSDFNLINYQCHGSLTCKMAI